MFADWQVWLKILVVAEAPANKEAIVSAFGAALFGVSLETSIDFGAAARWRISARALRG